jgi:hypothetical protein
MTTTSVVLPAPITTLPEIVTEEDFEDVSIVIANAIPKKFVVEGDHPNVDSAIDEFSRSEMTKARLDNLPVQMTHLGDHTEMGTVRAFRPGPDIEVVMGIDTDDSPASITSENFLFNGYYEDVSVCHDWSTNPIFHDDGTHKATVVEKTPIEISLCREGARTGSHISAFLPSKAAMERQNWTNLHNYARNNGFPPPPKLNFKSEDHDKRESQRNLSYPCNTESLRNYVETVIPLVKTRRTEVLAKEGYIASSKSHHSIRTASRKAAAASKTPLTSVPSTDTGRTKMSNPGGASSTSGGPSAPPSSIVPAAAPSATPSGTPAVVGSGTATPKSSDSMALDGPTPGDNKALDDMESSINKDEQLAKMMKENADLKKREQEREDTDRKKAAGMAKSEVDLMMTDADVPADLKTRLNQSAEDAEEVMRSLPVEQSQKIHNLLFGIRAASKFAPKTAPSTTPPKDKNKSTKRQAEPEESPNDEEVKRWEQRRMALVKREIAAKQNLNVAMSTVNAIKTSRTTGTPTRTAAKEEFNFPHEVGRVSASATPTSGTTSASKSVSSTVGNTVISRSGGKIETGRPRGVNFAVILKDSREVMRKNNINSMMTETDWLHGGVVAIATGRTFCNADGEDEEEVEITHRFKEPIALPPIFKKDQTRLGPQHVYPERFAQMKAQLTNEMICPVFMEDCRDIATRFETERQDLFVN